MIGLGLLHSFFDIQFLQVGVGIFLSQPKYVLNLLQRFKMKDCKLCVAPYHLGVKLTKEFDSMKINVTLYRKLVGSIICQLCISFSISMVS